MNDASQLVIDTTRRIFRDLGDPKELQATEARAQLWQALEDAGLARAWIDDSLGGAGATLADGFAVLGIAGEYAVAVPLAENLLAGWLLAQANIAVPDGVTTIAPVDPRDRLILSDANEVSGAVRAVPFAREARHVAAIVGRGDDLAVALLRRSDGVLTEHQNIAREPRDGLRFDRAAAVGLAKTRITYDDLQLMGAAVRAVQLAGALQGMLDLTVAYANERVAFEKPIGKFQAIQHSLAKLAGEVAAAVSAAGSAADAIHSSSHFDQALFLEVASAKIRIGEAVTAGTAIAHQVHGAIGFTEEHVLHRYSQRLWAWRDDFGVESDWALRLGMLVARNGGDALWPMLAAR